jgi:hypothetical protein
VGPSQLAASLKRCTVIPPEPTPSKHKHVDNLDSSATELEHDFLPPLPLQYPTVPQPHAGSASSNPPPGPPAPSHSISHTSSGHLPLQHKLIPTVPTSSLPGSHLHVHSSQTSHIMSHHAGNPWPQPQPQPHPSSGAHNLSSLLTLGHTIAPMRSHVWNQPSSPSLGDPVPPVCTTPGGLAEMHKQFEDNAKHHCPNLDKGTQVGGA